MTNKEISVILFLTLDAITNGDYNLNTREELAEKLDTLIDILQINKKSIMCCMRLILTGSANGLPVTDIMSYIGKEDTLNRLIYAIKMLP